MLSFLIAFIIYWFIGGCIGICWYRINPCIDDLIVPLVTFWPLFVPIMGLLVFADYLSDEHRRLRNKIDELQAEIWRLEKEVNRA